ncbi:hypothetical protein ACFVGM_10670 [Kitasatospora purpeofusca]|uniref:hypothetical protein n=1 Tax=Kitasatospora purpeofusca TaxID=67352 RepID=UPI0036B1A3E5
MDAREGDGPGAPVRDPDRPEHTRPAVVPVRRTGPAGTRASGTTTDEDRDQEDAERYAVLGED